MHPYSPQLWNLLVLRMNPVEISLKWKLVFTCCHKWTSEAPNFHKWKYSSNYATTQTFSVRPIYEIVTFIYYLTATAVLNLIRKSFLIYTFTFYKGLPTLLRSELIPFSRKCKLSSVEPILSITGSLRPTPSIYITTNQTFRPQINVFYYLIVAGFLTMTGRTFGREVSEHSSYPPYIGLYKI